MKPALKLFSTFEAKVIFTDLARIPDAISHLRGHGFTVEIMPWVDFYPEGERTRYTYAILSVMTDRTREKELWDLVKRVVESFDGDLCHAGFGTRPEREIMAEEDRARCATEPDYREFQRQVLHERALAGLPAPGVVLRGFDAATLKLLA